MIEGAVFELEEMGPGQGMGKKTTVRVTDTHAVVAIDSGRVKTSGYGQIKRSVLLEAVADSNEVAELEADDLEDPL